MIADGYYIVDDRVNRGYARVYDGKVVAAWDRDLTPAAVDAKYGWVHVKDEVVSSLVDGIKELINGRDDPDEVPEDWEWFEGIASKDPAGRRAWRMTYVRFFATRDDGGKLAIHDRADGDNGGRPSASTFDEAASVAGDWTRRECWYNRGAPYVVGVQEYSESGELVRIEPMVVVVPTNHVSLEWMAVEDAGLDPETFFKWEGGPGYKCANYGHSWSDQPDASEFCWRCKMSRSIRRIDGGGEHVRYWFDHDQHIA